MSLSLSLIVTLAACASSPAAPSQPHGAVVDVAGGEIRVLTPDGREVRSADLVGATMLLGTHVVRLDAVKLDKSSAGILYLHEFSVISTGGALSPLCEADALGERWAIAVLDEWARIDLVCSSGAIGKCIRWGYPPAKTATTPGRLHNACVHMVRADYGGDGTPMTRDGTLIAFCDRQGVHPCAGGEHRIEAAWFDGGAACVAQPRIPELVTLEKLAKLYPNLVGHLGADCSMLAVADDDRVMLFSWAPSTKPTKP